MKTFKHILIATDFASTWPHVVDLAATLALACDSQLTLMHVCEIPVYPYMGVIPSADTIKTMEDLATKRLAEGLTELQSRVPRAKSILKLGVPTDEILAAAKELRADLIVMGTHGRRGLSHLLIGSVAEKVVRMAPVAVLTARAAAA